MPIRDVIVAAISRPAGKVVDAPVRDIINEMLSERGYASPAEVAALRDEADALRGQLDALQGAVQDISSQLEAVQGQLSELQQRPAQAAPANHAVLVPSIPAVPQGSLEQRQSEAVVATEQGQCLVDGCTEPARRDGFCTAHAEQWRAGFLPGVVSPEGLVSVDGQARRIAPGHAGALYAVVDGQVHIGDQSVPSVPY